MATLPKFKKETCLEPGGGAKNSPKEILHSVENYPKVILVIIFNGLLFDLANVFSVLVVPWFCGWLIER
jgi:hypothetical protein